MDQYSDSDSDPSEMMDDDFAEEDIDIPEKPARGGRGGKKGTKGGIDLDECAKTIQKFQHENEEINSDFANIRTQSQGQARRILDLAQQFDEARGRIDRLLGRGGSKGSNRDSYASDSSSDRGDKKSLRRQVSYASADIKPKHEDLGVVQLTVKLESGQDDYGEASDV